MGNSQSNDNKEATPASPASPASGHHRYHVVRREKSANLKSAPPPPTLISTQSSAATSTKPTRTNAHATDTSSPTSQHTRARSITATGSNPRSKPAVPANSLSEGLSPLSVGPMGNEQSRNRPPSRSNQSSTPIPVPTTAPLANQPSTKPQASPLSQPVDVPRASHALAHDDFVPGGPSGESPYNHGPSNYNRPPRLPLPIEEELHTPGSPIITPQGVSNELIDASEVEGVIPRRSSVLSTATADDEDVTENDVYTEEKSLAPTVPTKLEWKGPGDKVYLTGTFVQWERKFKLHRDKETGGFSAVVPLKPGTHHLKFLVDGEMTTSTDLPTTVDWTNILVNYVEVVAPVHQTASVQPPVPAEPMPIPGAALTAGQAVGTNEAAARPAKDAQVPGTTQDIPFAKEAKAAPEVRHPSAVGKAKAHTQSPSPKSQPQAQHPPSKLPKKVVPRPKYTTQIPQYLVDGDTYSNPTEERFQRSSRLVGSFYPPPSLPMFLGKSILNGATPHKDDASVLIMPNHTVLNHLATSSIKSGVLATSGTTRYKRKFLTTIMYKPSSKDG